MRNPCQSSGSEGGQEKENKSTNRARKFTPGRDTGTVFPCLDSISPIFNRNYAATKAAFNDEKIFFRYFLGGIVEYLL